MRGAAPFWDNDPEAASPSPLWVTMSIRRAQAICYILMVSCLLAGVNAAPPAFGSLKGPNGGIEPVWSPDGTKLAFLSGTPTTPLNVWVVDTEGDGEPRQLTQFGARLKGWSGDGSAIFFHTLRGSTSAYYAIDVATGDRTPVLTFLPQDARQVVLSQDGGSAAYLRPHERHKDLWVADVAGASAHQLTEEMYVRTAAWSHDSGRLAFDVGGVAGMSTFVVSASGEVEPVRVFGGVGSEPSWSPDDSRLALLGMHTVIVVSAEGGDAKRLHVSQANRAPLDWAGEGKTLAFTSVQGSVLAVSTVDVESGEEDVVSTGWTYAGHARWSPDGGRLAFGATAVGGSVSDIYILDVGAEEPRRLTRASASFWDAQWAGDSASWVFLTNGGGAGRIQLRVGGIDGGAEGPALQLRPRSAPQVRWPQGSDRGLAFRGKNVWLVPRRGRVERLLDTAHPTWADLGPDGISVAYVRWDDGKPSLVVRPIAGGEEREVLSPPAAGLSYSKVAWSPTGGAIAFVRGGEICTVPAEGGDATVIWSGNSADDSMLLAPAWSPEGRWLVFGRFVKGEGQRLEIIVSDAGGGGSQVVASCDMEVEPGTISDWLSRPYAWSPGGGKLAFCLEQEGRPALYVAPVAEGVAGARILVRAEAAFPAWSPDGSELIYTALEGNVERIRLYGLSEGTDDVFEVEIGTAAGREAPDPGPGETIAQPEQEDGP